MATHKLTTWKRAGDQGADCSCGWSSPAYSHAKAGTTAITAHKQAHRRAVRRTDPTATFTTPLRSQS